MSTIGMNYEIREGKDQTFEKMFGKVLDIMGKTEGHVKTHLYRDVFETRSYLIVVYIPILPQRNSICLSLCQKFVFLSLMMR